jgi:hypothetical protein
MSNKDMAKLKYNLSIGGAITQFSKLMWAPHPLSSINPILFSLPFVSAAQLWPPWHSQLRSPGRARPCPPPWSPLPPNIAASPPQPGPTSTRFATAQAPSVDRRATSYALAGGRGNHESSSRADAPRTPQLPPSSNLKQSHAKATLRPVPVLAPAATLSSALVAE